MQRKKYDLIDIIKLICAILVVTIHVEPSESEALNFFFQKYIARIAVPFFFITAGYFSFKKENVITSSIRYTWRMIVLYVIWFLIYMLPVVFGGKFSMYYIKSFIGGYEHLWYLKASAFAFLAVGVLIYKKISLKFILIIGLILYGIGIFGQTYYGLVFDINREISIVYTRNGLFFGFLFVAIGAMFAYGKININRRVSLVCLICSLILWAAEAVVVNKMNWALDNNMSIFMLPSAVLLFNNALNADLKVKFNTKILRDLSTNIYFTHLFVRDYIVTDNLNVTVRIMCVLAVSVIISLALIKLKNIRGFKWLNVLS